MFAFDRARVIRTLAIRRKERILEIGVGTGLNLQYYPAESRVVGIDFSKAMLARARRKQSKAKITLLHRDASRTKLASNTFDKALATYVLRVAPNPRAVLHEVARVTKQGSRFVILDQFAEGRRWLFALVEPFQKFLGWGKNYSLSSLLKGTPWRIVSKRRFGRMRSTRLVVLKNMKH